MAPHFIGGWGPSPDVYSFILQHLSLTAPLEAHFLLLLASFLCSFVTVSAGIGGGILLISILASLLPASALIPVHGFIQFGSNFSRLLILVRSVDWSHWPLFASGSILGAFIGGTISVSLNAAFVQIGIGIFVLWSVLQHPPQWMAKAPAINGLISSFLSMLFGSTGPFVAVFTKSLELPRHSWVATQASFMGLHHLLKIVVFSALGFNFLPWLPFILAMIIAGFLGTLAGRYLVLDHTDERVFRLILNGLLLILAVRLILAGVQPLLY